MRQVKLTRLTRPPRHEIGRGPVQVAIDTKGKPFSWSAERIDRRSDAEGEYRFLRCSGDAIKELPIPPQMGLHPQLYPFVDGRLLLVFHRSVRGNGDNAAVFARDGTLLTRFRTGDAVADVQITARGDIWVAYFDETIEAELDCFDHQGRKFFSYDTFRETHNLPMMVDCYAVNTSSDVDTWVYYYPDFRLVHLSKGEYAGHWDTSAVQGARAIAVDGERVLFAGTYKARDSLFLFELGTGAIEELQLVHERGQPIPLANCHGTGRGTQLYLHGGWFLYTVDLAEIS